MPRGNPLFCAHLSELILHYLKVLFLSALCSQQSQPMEKIFMSAALSFRFALRSLAKKTIFHEENVIKTKTFFLQALFHSSAFSAFYFHA
jgi:hypothetical protein